MEMAYICTVVAPSIIEGILGIDTGRAAVDAALVAGIVTLAVAVLRGIGLVLGRAQERQRTLYSKAYEAAMAWNEMVYRVRRRANEDDTERELVERFHTLQERIDYFEGWTASEGASIGTSYCRLVREIKNKTEPLIRAAWAEPGRAPSDPTPDDDEHADLRQERDRFLKDVRAQLSLLLLPRLAVWKRSKGTSSEKGTGS